MPVELALEDPLADHPRYEKIRELNTGAFGFVILAKDLATDNQEEVAIKFLPRGPRINVNVEREILNHKNLLHHHVIQFKGVFLTPRYLAIVMEYAPGGDLMDYIRKKRGISEELSRWFFQQLMIGLDYCHKVGVINRDIKLENTLLDNSDWPLLKICDFGYSKREEIDSAPTSLVGTRPYLAPEVIFRERTVDPYDGKKADIWCCGVLLYVMMVGRYPFERPGEEPRRDANTIRERVRNLDYIIPPNSMSTECEDLIKKILVSDPEARPSIAQIQNHPWYLIGLPSGALNMNEHLERQPSLQSEPDIRALCREAQIDLT